MCDAFDRINYRASEIVRRVDIPGRARAMVRHSTVEDIALRTLATVELVYDGVSQSHVL